MKETIEQTGKMYVRRKCCRLNHLPFCRINVIVTDDPRLISKHSSQRWALIKFSIKYLPSHSPLVIYFYDSFSSLHKPIRYGEGFYRYNIDNSSVVVKEYNMLNGEADYLVLITFIVYCGNSR